MSRKKNSQNDQSKKTKRQANPVPWRYCVLTLFCGLLLISGFFFAARQHFSSIDYSIKNSRLRKQLDELEADKRRLVLAKEIALSPAEIKKVAKKIGFTEATDKLSNSVPAGVNSAVKQSADKLKQTISNKIEAVKKIAETPVKEAIKVEKPQNTRDDKPDKSSTQIAAAR